MKLEIILRIHDDKNIHGNKPRYIDIPKKDLIFGCLSSLINSANVVTNTEIFLLFSMTTVQMIVSQNYIKSFHIQSIRINL